MKSKTLNFKKTFPFLIAALFLLLVAYKYPGLEKNRPSNTPEAKNIQESGVALVDIDFGNKKRKFEGEVNNHTFPLSTALVALSRDTNVTYQVRNGKIEDIAGVRGAWRIYRNGVRAEAPLDKLVIARGDHYTLKLEK